MMVENTGSMSGGTGFRFTVPYHYENSVRAMGFRCCHPGRVKRLAQEAVTLSTSLPLSYSSSVFVRCDTDRLDVMKVNKITNFIIFHQIKGKIEYSVCDYSRF